MTSVDKLLGRRMLLPNMLYQIVFPVVDSFTEIAAKALHVTLAVNRRQMSPQRVRGRQHERTDATLEASIAACGAVSVSDVRRQRALFVELAATPLTLQRVAVSAAVNGGHVDLEVRSLRETLGTERALELVIVGVRDAVSRRQVVTQALGELEHP